ncbi:MAG: peptide transporter permease, partial [Tardiphaga sp.]|nr:peptide transporter permease [Tardiphaga sp.]
MTDTAFSSVDSKQLAIASQWQLVWWAFKRHRLAMAGLIITAFLYVIAVAPGFFAINDPSQQNARAAYYPPQLIHFVDTAADGSWSIRPYIHPY